LFAVLGLVGCDHGTKLAARAFLQPRGPLMLIRGVLELRYAENYDSAFSLTRGLSPEWKPYLLGAGATLTLGFVAFWWWRRRHVASRYEHLALAAVVAGAIGNVSDRLLRGFVVDFVYLHHWPIFNVADILVVVGGAALALTSQAGATATVGRS
jgi:signal peptidase II